MDVQSVLLGFLMRNSMTGYDLKKAFALSFSFFSGLSYGSIYPALKRMETEGLISKRLEIQDGAPNRKVYTIEEGGRKAFLDALRSPVAAEQPKSSFLMRLFFFGCLSSEERKTVAVAHLDSVMQVGERLESVRSEVEAHADRFQYQCFLFGLRFYQDLARNLSETIQALNQEETENVE